MRQLPSCRWVAIEVRLFLIEHNTKKVVFFRILASLELIRKKDKEQRVKEQRAECKLVQAENNTETEDVATHARLKPVTRRRAAALRSIEPRTATKHTVLSRVRSLRIN